MNPLSAVARLVVAVAVSFAIAAPASAGRRFVSSCGHYATTQAVIQPAYNHTPYVSATYNFVGAPVRLQAEQAYAMKNDPQWQQFQAWKQQQQTQQMAQALFQQWSAHQGQQQAAPATGVPVSAAQWATMSNLASYSQQQAPQQTVATGYAAGYQPAQPGEPGATPTYDEATGKPSGQWVKGGPPGQVAISPATGLPWTQAELQAAAQQQTCPPGTECPPDSAGVPAQAPGATAPGPLPPAAPGVPNAAQPSLQPHASKIPLLVEYCGRCHNQEKPAGEFAFDGSVDYTIKGTGPAAEAMAAKRDQILQAIVSQRMPKDGALDPAVAGAIVAELYSGE